MCGVVGGWSIDATRVDELAARVSAGIDAVAHRGPDARGVLREGRAVLGHTRLAIQDLDARSNQPFVYGSVTLCYNGELWNAAQLRAQLQAQGCAFVTTGDTEVLAAALHRWGTQALHALEGQFAFAWVDVHGYLYLARDRFGEVPMHYSPSSRVFASELGAMRAMGARDVAWLQPGSYVRLSCAEPPREVRWYTPPARAIPRKLDEAAPLVRAAVENGCAARTISDVPVCTLLSGGLDSSVVAYHMAKLVPNLVAYVAVLDEKARDLRCARAVAEALGLELREVRVAPPSADELAEVVRIIEQPHKAQVEIGWACLSLARRMRADGFRVTFSGEGSDELWASYGFAYHGAKKEGWHTYRRKLFLEQHRKNFARCNKVFMRHGVECRLPFLETRLVELALSLPRAAVVDGKAAKAALSRGYRGVLPDEVLDRPKVAFQDGMKLKDACADAVADPTRFYRLEFARHFPGVEA